jgi:glyoxalase-like protein
VLTGIDHVILAAADPDAAANAIEARLGLRAVAGGRHEAHGTFNRLIWFGDSYIELMGVFDPDLATQSWWGRHIRRLLAQAGLSYGGLVIASDDVASDVTRLEAQGSPITAPQSGERVRTDGGVVRWSVGRLPEPDPDVGLLFLIEHDPTGAEWTPGERAARAAEKHPVGTRVRLLRAELPVRQTRTATSRLLRDVGAQFRPSLSGQGARDATLGSQTLRLVPTVAGASARIVLRGGTEARVMSVPGLAIELAPSQVASKN